MPFGSKFRSHILSIQDNEDDAKFLKKLWAKDADVTFLSAENSAAPIAELHTVKHRPSLITLAGREPENARRTLDILTQLKSNRQISPIPVVILYGNSDPETIGLFYAAGACCVIKLPNTPPEFEAMMQCMKTFWLHVARLPFETAAA